MSPALKLAAFVFVATVFAFGIYRACLSAQRAAENADILWIATGLGRGQAHPSTAPEDVLKRALNGDL